MYDNAVVSEVDWVRGVGIAAVDVGHAVRVEASVVNATDEPILKQSARLVPNITLRDGKASQVNWPCMIEGELFTQRDIFYFFSLNIYLNRIYLVSFSS